MLAKNLRRLTVIFAMAKGSKNAPLEGKQLAVRIDEILDCAKQSMGEQTKEVDRKLNISASARASITIVLSDVLAANLPEDLLPVISEHLMDSLEGDWKSRVTIELKIATKQAAANILDKYTRRSRG